jgi:hypothetical protein
VVLRQQGIVRDYRLRGFWRVVVLFFFTKVFSGGIRKQGV